MKLAKHNNSLQTNTEVKSQNFGIGDASVVIEILRNRLYRHPIRTLVQEYISNGRDAMREVDSKQAIDVTVPNRLHPTFKVRDYGPGICPERIKDVFVLYGASTKRDSNNQTGGFGIGAKSAWSYTDSFTIKTFVDGTMRSYVAHTGVNNNGRLDLISTDKTDAPNGTEIQIAVNPSDLKAFSEAVLRTVYFWDDNTYNLKGVVDAELTDRTRGSEVVKGLEVLPSGALPSYISGGKWDSNPLAVIDGIPYILESNFDLGDLENLCQGQIVLHIDTGILEVSASRESVADSQVSKDAIKDLVKAYTEAVKKFLLAEFAKAKTVAQYVTIHNDMSDKFNVSGLSTYKGYAISYGRLKNDDIFSKVDITMAYMRNGKLYKYDPAEKTSRRSYGKPQCFNVEHVNRWFYFNGGESKVAQNKRIREFLTTNGPMLIVSEKDSKTAFDKIKRDLELKDLTSISYTDTPREVKPKVTRTKQEFCVHDYTSYGREHVYLTLSDNTQKWLYVPVKNSKYNMSDLKELVRYLGDYKICAIGSVTENLVKGNANFTSMDKFLKDFKPSAKEVMSRNYHSRQNESIVATLKQLKDLDDKFLTEMVETYAKLKHVNKIPKLIADKCKEIPSVKVFNESDKRLSKLMKEQYPLVAHLDYLGRKDTQEISFYINAKHREVKNG